MAITKSARKAHRQSLRRKALNDVRKRAISSTFKAVRTAAEGLPAGRQGDKAALALAYKAIDKAQKRGLIKKNTAARRKARVARMLARP